MWADLRRRPSHLAVLAVCALGVVVHQLVRWNWFIDDSAIVFAYARNVANGEGFVPWPGGERIEAVSDPTWTLLLTLFHLVGLDGFEIAKPLGMLFAILCLPYAYATTRLALPEHDGPAPLFAAVFLALNAQLAIWSASGLENGLWCFLLIAAIHTTIREARAGRFLGSSALFFLLAWTRPEGVLYAAVGGFWFLVMLWRAGQPVVRPVLGWLVVFWVPSLLIEALRLWYFAWPVPNTWYAKIAVRPQAFSWNERGWNQAREWAGRLWHGWYLPVYLVGLLGLDGRRARWGLALCLVTALTLLYPAPHNLAALRIWPDLPVFEPWVTARVGLFVLVGVTLPLFAIGRSGWEARVLCFSFAVLSVLFSVYAGGDWMGAYRWMSLMAPNLAVLFAVGLATLADLFERKATGRRTWDTVGWLTVAFGLFAMIPPNFSQTRDHTFFNVNETPLMVKRRVDTTQEVLRRTMYEGPVYNLDMDMGAHVWWAPEYENLDMAGLVDVPMARHWYGQRAFYEEYVFTEHPPTFAHVHYWWAKFTGFKLYDGFDELFELPYYLDVEPVTIIHDGCFARRSLFVQPAWSGPGPRIEFEGGPVLHGYALPTGAWPRGSDGLLEAGWSTTAVGETFRVVAFLSDGERLRTWDLPMGYDMLRVDGWRADEVFVGRFPLAVPPDVPEGTYDLGLVVYGPDGVRAPLAVPEGVVVGAPGDARYAVGEVRFPGAVTVTAREDRDQRAAAIVARAVGHAREGRCDEAEQDWQFAKRHRWRDEAWKAEQRPAVDRAIADCWALRAEAEPERAPEHLARAHGWDHWSPELARVGAPVGERLWAEGERARAAKDWEAAYRAYSALLEFEPWRSWARRYAEEARDERLQLGPLEPKMEMQDTRPDDDER